MKDFFRSEAWGWIRCGLELALIVLIVVLVITFLQDIGFAEGETQNVWVLCDPDSFVCVREAPRKSAYAVGGSTCGTMLQADGKRKNGYIHVVNLAAEDNSGWICEQYIVYDEPRPMNRTATVVSNGKLAVRKGIGGKIKKWLYPMKDTVKIRWWSNEWCLTTIGYVQTAYLELDGED